MRIYFKNGECLFLMLTYKNNKKINKRIYKRREREKYKCVHFHENKIQLFYCSYDERNNYFIDYL